MLPQCCPREGVTSMLPQSPRTQCYPRRGVTPMLPPMSPQSRVTQMLPQSRVTCYPRAALPQMLPRAALPLTLPQSRVTPNVTPGPRYPKCYPQSRSPMPPLSYAVASKLLQRSSCLQLIQNRKGVERTASDQKRKIDRAQGVHLRAASMKPKSLQTSVSKGGARAESFLVSLLVL